MTAPDNVIVLSTDEFDGRHREAMVREFYGRICMRLDLQPLEPGNLRVHAATTILGAVSATRAAVAPMAWERGSGLLDDSCDDLAISWIASGWRFDRPGRASIETEAGAPCLMHFDRPWRAEAANGEWTVCTQLPRSLLAPLVPDIDDIEPDAIRRDTPEAHLLLDYLSAVSRGPIGPRLAPLVTQHIADLLAAAIGTGAEGRQIVAGRGVRAARMRAIRQYIELNLGSSRLSAETTGRHFQLSPRYIRRLFAAEGTSFSDYVTERRLARIYSRLCDPRFAAIPIASLALEEGLAEPSTFYRQFKARYGVRPSDLRAAGVAA